MSVTVTTMNAGCAYRPPIRTVQFNVSLEYWSDSDLVEIERMLSDRNSRNNAFKAMKLMVDICERNGIIL